MATKLTEEHKRNIGKANSGLNNGMYGRHHSPEIRRQISETMKRKKLRPPSQLGANFSDSHRKHLSESRKGITFSQEHRQNIGLAQIGRKQSKETISKRIKKGIEHYNWQGGITPLNFAVRNLDEYKKWRNQVFIRDNYVCTECGKKGGDLEVHHINALSNILKENDIQNVEQAQKCKKLWDINNGIVLCIECHSKTDNYRANLRRNTIKKVS